MAVADDDVQRMLDYCCDFARRSIAEAGEFDPFAAVIERSGKLEGLIFSDPSGQVPAAHTYAIAEASLTRKFDDGEILAGALVTNCRMSSDSGTDYLTAVKFEVETAERSIRLYLPYEITKKFFRRRHVAFGQMTPMV